MSAATAISLAARQATEIASISSNPETTAVCQDFLVVAAVLRNRSPRTKFPVNRENNWESLNIWPFRPKTDGRSCAFSASYEENSLSSETGNDFQQTGNPFGAIGNSESRIGKGRLEVIAGDWAEAFINICRLALLITVAQTSGNLATALIIGDER